MFVTNAAAGIANPVQPTTPLVDFIKKVKEIDKLAENAEAALNVFSDKVSESTWAQALNELGIESAEITRRIERLTGYLVQAQEGWEPLLLTLADRPEAKPLPLGYEKSKDLAVGEIAFSLAAQADLALSVRNQLASSTPTEWGTVLEGDALQIFAARGSLGVGASASAAPGTLSFGASATATASLYFQYAASTPIAVALIQSADGFAFPWDLKGLESALQPMSSDGRWRGLRRAQLIGTGNFRLAGQAKVGRSLTYVGDSYLPDAEATLGATIGFSLSRNGTFKIEIEKGVSRRLRVNVKRAIESERSASIDLGADIDVTGLDQAARRYADQFLTDPAGIIKDVEKWKKPGDRIAELIDGFDSELTEKLGELLTGETSARGASQFAAGRLEELLTTELNEHLSFWDTIESESVARNAIAHLSERLGLDARLQQLLSEKLQEKLVEWIDGAKDNLEREITERIDSVISDAGDSAADKLREFLKPLEDVGAEVDELVSDLDAVAGKVQGQVLEWLKRYEKIRRKIYAALDKVAKLQVSLEFSASLNATRGRKTILSFELAKVTEEALMAYRALLLGRFDQAWSAFETARDNKDIVNIDGVFAAWVNRERSIGLSLRLGEFAAEMSRVKAEDVNVEVAPDGQVLVAGVTVSQEATSQLAYASRKASMFGAYDLVAAAEDPDAFPTPIGFTLGYSDEHMRSKELRQLLESLEEEIHGRRLLREGATADALQRYNEFTTGERSANARVDLALPVRIEDLAALIEIEDRVIRETATQMLVDAVLSYHEKAIAAHLASSDEDDPTHFLPSVSSGQRRRIRRPLRNIEKDAENLVDAVNQIREIAKLQRRIARQKREHELSDAQTPFEIRDDLRRQLDEAAKAINDNLSRWLTPRGPISGIFTEAIPGRTVALLQLLALLGRDAGQIVPVVKVFDLGGEEFVVV